MNIVCNEYQSFLQTKFNITSLTKLQFLIKLCFFTIYNKI